MQNNEFHERNMRSRVPYNLPKEAKTIKEAPKPVRRLVFGEKIS
jgi:hypothetical protein